MHIRDPIHGAIEISRREKQVIDSRFFQRLRHIKQLGFADLAFPGATHTRYAHGIGAMAVATRLFDALFSPLGMPDAERTRLRQTLRLAVLLHDLGHPPLSHTSERILPRRSELRLPVWACDGAEEQATHEDMTLLFVLESGLTELLREGFGASGIEPGHIASLVCGRAPEGADWFRVGGRDYGPLLRQLVSSELDADRMDYLLRDSLYAGVHYGRYDLDWIVQNVTAVEREGAMYLGMGHRAVFAFEDFLLSRYHMFLAVYYHYMSINFEQILARFYADSAGEYRLSADPERYVLADDLELLSVLRASPNRWARRIVERRGFLLLVEANPFEREVDLEPLLGELRAAGIDHFRTESYGILSKYFLAEGRAPIFVRRTEGGVVPVEDYTPLFRRYAESARLVRVYVEPEQAERARRIAGPLARA